MGLVVIIQQDTTIFNIYVPSNSVTKYRTQKLMEPQDEQTNPSLYLKTQILCIQM